MEINRYDIQDVTDDEKLISRIMNTASKFSSYINYKKPAGYNRAGRCTSISTFDLDLLIEAYKTHSKNSARPDYKQKYDELIVQMTDIKNKKEDKK